MKTKEEILGKQPFVSNNARTGLYVSIESAHEAMSEYAKQQAIAFLNHYLSTALINVNNLPAPGEGDRAEVRYAQFLKQQQSKQP